MAVAGFVYWQVASGGAAPVDAFGHLLGWTDGNNVSTVMAYDQATGAPVGISSGIGQSSAVQSLIYTWDGFGNLEQRCDANRGLAENVTDDDLNRLTGSTVYTGVSVSGSTCAGGSTTNTLAPSYDAMGNITNRTVNGTVETYAYDPNHPYAVGTVKNSTGTTLYSASYDADGNMVSRNGYQIQWTPSNLPSSIASALGSSTFSYDPDHNRYYQAATFNGTTTDTTYVGGLFEMVSSSNGTTEYRHNILADGQVIAVHAIDGNGAASTSYLHYDHLGSVDAITGDSGSVIQSMSFDAFGLRRDAANWDYDLSQNTLATLKNTTDRGYTFQEELDNVGLVHMNGRVYDPTVGRFISADPLVFNPFYSEALNRYTYVYDNPLNATDPTGYLCDCSMTGQQLQQWAQFSASVPPQVLLGIMGFGEIVVGVVSAEADPFSSELLSNGAENLSAAFTVSDVASAAASSVVATQGVVDLSSSLFNTPDPNVVDALATPTLGQNSATVLNDLLLAKDFNDFLKTPSLVNSAGVTLDWPSVPGLITTGNNINNNGNQGNSLIQLPSGCGCNGSYTGPNESGSDNSVMLGPITVTAPIAPTIIPPPPPPPQPICMDGSGKVTTCPP